MAGLSTDLIIEQVLMQSLKTSGGLTRPRYDVKKTAADMASGGARFCRNQSCNAKIYRRKLQLQLAS